MVQVWKEGMVKGKSERNKKVLKLTIWDHRAHAEKWLIRGHDERNTQNELNQGQLSFKYGKSRETFISMFKKKDNKKCKQGKLLEQICIY